MGGSFGIVRIIGTQTLRSFQITSLNSYRHIEYCRTLIS